MTSRKKPGMAFWATVVVVAALAAYPLSFGPACWISSRASYGEILPFYRPVEWAIRRSRAAEIAFLRYAELASPAHSWWHLDNHGRLTLGYYPPPPIKSSVPR
jgi:hypothetical protein